MKSIKLSIRLTAVLISLTLFSAELFSQEVGRFWTGTVEGDFIVKGERRIIPDEYKTTRLNLDAMSQFLAGAPIEKSGVAPIVVELPVPDGRMELFYVEKYSMMEEPLARQFPEFITLTVKGINDPYAVGKLDVTAHGFHGMVLTPNGDFFIDPYSSDEKEVYLTYYKSKYRSKQNFECLVNEIAPSDEIIRETDVTGEQLRTYRLANAATGEYTVYHGGTVTLGQSAIVTAVNRVNGVYERDFSVRMTLVANNTSIVYTNGATDPYSNNNGVTMLSQNQSNLDAVIGSGNYDIGHVFSTGGGGVAGLGVVCLNGNKARGVTGLPAPIGDPFYIDYVAHEMGHQYRANHTFNSVTSSCGGGNRNGSTAWEPGSGSTIMAYAGICGADNLQNNSDDLFHSGSISEIISYTQTSTGNTCPVITNTGNTPPSVTVPTGGFTIPISTPFELTGSATDINNPGSLTYIWEQYDTGPSGSPNSPSGNAPIFRSFNVVTTPTRTFPKISDIVNNTQTLGEILPTYTRSLRFRFTVRDNNPGGGGINIGTVLFNVSSAAGPFTVSSPNTAVVWTSASQQTVTWNVANTNNSPVNCANVNIKLSTDGGYTYPYTLATNTPNDGTENITLPGVSSTTARVRVEAAGNIFFDISNTNFTISAPVVSIIRVTPQGYHNAVTNYLNAKDTVRYYLRNISSPYAVVDSAKGVLDTISSNVSVNFANAPSGTYYIVAKHRNCITTWSRAGGQPYTQGSPLNYNFTLSASQAYGSNMIQVDASPVRFAMYSGDADNDGAIDATDLSLIDNDAANFVTGYVITDLDGNDYVDATDALIADNNAANFISVISP